MHQLGYLEFFSGAKMVLDFCLSLDISLKVIGFFV